jgi:mannose-1-phosphate guanylyltransferase
MKALLLAGGFGTRLKPLTDKTPKCLVPVNGKPLLDYWLDMLIDAGIDRILINTHYLSEQVINHCNNSPFKGRIDLIYENELLGTAGTLRFNQSYFDGPIFLAHADNFSIFEPKEFFLKHQNRSLCCSATMMTFTTDTPKSCGVVETNEMGELVGYHEKVQNPPGNCANAAVFILENECLHWLKELPDATDFCKDVIPLKFREFNTFHNTIYHRDIGTIDSLNQANIDYKNLAKKLREL